MVVGTGAVSGGIVTRDDLTGFNWSTVPVFPAGTGFMTNVHDDRLLDTQTNGTIYPRISSGAL